MCDSDAFLFKNKADEIMLLLEKRYQMAAESGVSTEIERLISTAVDMTNLSKMFPGKKRERYVTVMKKVLIF